MPFYTPNIFSEIQINKEQLRFAKLKIKAQSMSITITTMKRIVTNTFKPLLQKGNVFRKSFLLFFLIAAILNTTCAQVKKTNLTLLKKEKKELIEKQHKQYSNNKENHKEKANRCKPLHKDVDKELEEEGEENEEYDGPDIAALFEFNRTKDPSTGKVPRERILPAIEQTQLSKNLVAKRNTNLNKITGWVERGPISDVPGPSNGNTRANNGLSSGRVRAMMVDSNDATRKTVFIGGVDGGLWKTNDITASPTTWTLINDQLSNLSIAAICQDPRPGFRNIMYFCTGESYYNGDAVRGNGVFKSIDGGATWTYLTNTSAFVFGTRILCDYLGNVYLATRGTGLRRSTDGGITWSVDLTPTGITPNICDMEISSTSTAGRLHIVTGIFSAQAYRYTDNPITVTSATWTSPATAFPTFSNRAEIACNGNTLYALPANGSSLVPSIYRSTDGGASWGVVGVPSNPLWVGGTATAGQGWYALAVSINPTNANEVIIGGLDTWKSTNGGLNWTQISTWKGTTPVNQYVHADVHNILWYDGGNKLVVASDGGIFFSNDNGATFRDKNLGLRIKQFYSCAVHPTLTNYFLAGAQDNGVHQFNNAGLSNSIEITGGDGGFVAIDQNQPQYQFGSYVYNQYRRSTNGGATWSFVNLNSTSGQFINPFDYDNTANIMYCGDVPNAYRRWTDPQTGNTSEVVTITSITGSVTAVSVSPYTANRVLFGTSGGKVVVVDGANTISSGSAGSDLSNGLPAGTISCIAFGSSDNNLLAVFTNYGINNIWVSTNGGTSWTACDGNLPDMPVRWAMFYPGDNSRAIIATETGVWETISLSGTFTKWEANPTFPIVRTDMLKYRSSDNTLVAATHGRGLWTTTLDLTSATDIQFQLSSDIQKETTTVSTGCNGYKDFTYNMTIANAPTGTATVTLGVVNGGTATKNVDYAILTPTLTFINGDNSPQPFTIRIYDDASTENTETLTLNYTISGTTNAKPGTENQTFTLTISDNDPAPFIPSTVVTATVGGTANYNAVQPFRSSYFDARTQILYSAAELSALGFFAGNITSIGFTVTTKNSIQPFNGFTIKLKNTSTSSISFGPFEGGATQVYSANYTTVLGLNTIPIAPFAWDGVSNLLVDICWDNTSGSPADDFIEASTTSKFCFYDRQNTNATPGCSLPSAGYQFSGGGARPLITLSIALAGTAVSSAIGNTKTAYLGPLDDVYFYDTTGKVMARIKNLTSFDYGCTQVIIDREGNTSEPFWNNNSANFLASKTFRVIPTNNNPTTGKYQITLYYSNAEVYGFDAVASPTTFASSRIVKVSNGYYIPDVTPTNTLGNNVLTTASTIATYGTQGNTITGTFTNTGFSGFGVGVRGCPILSITNPSPSSDTAGVMFNKTFTQTGAIGNATFTLNTGKLPTGLTLHSDGTLTGIPSVSGNFNITVKMTDANGCSVVGSTYTIVLICPPPSISPIVGDTTICVGSTSSLTNATSVGTWSSSNPSVAQVNTNGMVNGLTAGTTFITYTTAANTFGCTNKTSVLLSVNKSSNLTSTLNPTALCSGSLFSYNATASIAGSIITWTRARVDSIINPEINTPQSDNPNEILNSIAKRPISVVYTFNIDNNGCNTQSNVTLVINPATSIAPLTGFKTLCVGNTTTLSCTTPGGTWSSSSPSIAQVNTSGIVSAITAGNTVVSYSLTSSQGCTYNSSDTITINNLPTVGPITGTLVACINGNGNQLSNSTPGGVWTSSDITKATINSTTGLLSGIATGSTVITYKVTNNGVGCTKSISATVNVLSSPTVSIITGSGNTCVGASTQLSNATPGGIWSSSNTSIATVSSTGMVLGIAAGTVTITYTTPPNANGCTKSTTRTQVIKALPTVLPIAGSSIICLGKTSSFTNATVGGTWSSSNTSVATINSNGIVTGLTTGNTTISYTTAANSFGCKAVSSLQVGVFQNTNFDIASISAGANPLCTNKKTTLTANGVTGNNATVNWWTGSNGTGINIGSGLSLSNQPSGTYYARVTGACGSPVEKSIIVYGDTSKPTITCPANRVVANTGSCTKSIAIANPVFADNCSIQSLTWKMTGATISASATTDGIKYVGTKTFNNGLTLITYTIKDSANNSNICSFSITVNDAVKPVFTKTNSNIVDSLQTGCSKSITISPVAFTDNCGIPVLSWKMTGSTVASGIGQIGNYNINGGLTTITYTLTDAKGNTATSSFTVTLLDKVLPTISCPSNLVTNTVGTACTKSIGITPPIYSDNCKVKTLTWTLTGATVSNSPTTGINYVGVKTYSVGKTTVTYVAKDSIGNAATCSYSIQLNTTNICPLVVASKDDKIKNLEEKELKASITPNPTTSSFTLKIQTSSKEAIEVKVFNTEGKLIQQLKLMPQQSIQLGEKYLHGSYLFEITQGEKRTTVVGVKQ